MIILSGNLLLNILNHRNFNIILFGKFNRFFITCVNVADNAHSGVGGEDSFDAFGGFVGFQAKFYFVM